MSSHTEFDMGSLIWVKGEIDQAVARAKECLQQFADSGDSAKLKFAQSHLHQATGAIDMVGLSGLARLAEELEQIVVAMQQGVAPAPAIGLPLAMDAADQLTQYLEALLAGEPNVALQLAPVYCALRQARNESASAIDLFYPPLMVDLPALPGIRLPEAERVKYLKTARARFESGLLKWLKGDRRESGLWMAQALYGAMKVQDSAFQRGFWWAAGAVCESLSVDSDTLDMDIKQFLSRLNLQFRKQSESSGKVAERLFREVLYLAALLPSAGRQLAAVRECFGLPGLLPQAPLGDDKAQLASKALAREMRDLLLQAKESWSRYATTGGERIGLFQQQLAALLEKSQGLEVAALSALLTAVAEATKRFIVAGGGESGSLEIATALLLAENALECYPKQSSEFPLQVAAMTQRLQGNEETDVPLLDEISRKAQEKLLVSQVSQEIQSNLRMVEQVLDGFFRDPTTVAELATLAAPLRQIRGALMIMELHDACTLLDRSERLIERCRTGAGQVAQDELERLAESLSALGLYIAAVERGDVDPLALLQPLLPAVAQPAVAIEPPPETVEEEIQWQRQQADTLLADLRQQPNEAEIKDALKATLSSLGQNADLVADEQLAGQVSAATELLHATPDEVVAPSPVTEEAADAELLEIYLEEAVEVLANVKHHIDLVTEQPHNRDALTVIRRGFHTLKGSGRMVGLNNLGEVAWAVEQVLNKWLQEDKPSNALLLKLFNLTHAQFASWVSDLQTTGSTQVEASQILRIAEALNRGEETVAEAAGAIAPSVGAEPAPAPAIPVAKSPLLEIPAEQVVEEAVAAHDEAAGAAIPADVVVGSVVISPVLFGIFIEEANKHIDTLQREIAPLDQGGVVGQTLVHAAHTLCGIANTTGFTALGELGYALEQALVAAEKHKLPLGQTDIALLARTIQTAEQALQDIGRHSAPGLTTQLATELHDLEHRLLEEALTKSKPQEAEALTLTFDGGEVFDRELPEVIPPEEVEHFELDLDTLVISTAETAPAASEIELIAETPTADAVTEIDFDLEFSHDLSVLAAQAELPAAVEPMAEAGNEIEELCLDLSAAELPHTGDSLAQEALPVADLSPAPSFSLEGDLEFMIEDADALAETTETAAASPVALLPARDEEPSEELVDLSTLVEQPDIETLLAQSGQGFDSAAIAPVDGTALDLIAVEQTLVFEAPALPEAAAEIVELQEALPVEQVLEAEASLDQAPPELVQADVAEQAPCEAAALPAEGWSALAKEEVVELSLPPLLIEPEVPAEPALPAELVVEDVLAVMPESIAALVATAQPDVREVELPEVSERLAGIQVNDDIDEQLLPIFLEEAQELMPLIGVDLRQWRLQPDNAQFGESLRRTLHTLKGSARMAGAMRLGEVTHNLETRLLAAGEEPNTEVFDALDSDFDLVTELYDALSGKSKAAEPAAKPAAPTVATALAAPVMGLHDADLVKASVRVRADLIDRLVNQAGEVSISRSRIEAEMLALKQSLFDLTDNVTRLRSQLREIEIQAESQMQARFVLTQESHQTFDPLEFDRFSRLQELTRFMAESVNDVQTIQHNLLKNFDESTAALQQQGRMTKDLQQELMRVRMVPFSSISERLYRIVRQTSKEVGKKVNLELRGGRVEIDRSVLEKMTSPFEHMLRNAIDHGIENAEQRSKTGKPEFGEIQVDVRQEGNELVLTLKDDGAGLGLARIHAKALEKGLMQDGEVLSDNQLMQLIFAPGFSTASQISQISGRGIGMDVVQNEIHDLGGRVEVDSSEGKGTTFIIHLPLTLAVTQAVLIKVGAKTYAIPSVMVEQVQELKQGPLEKLYQDKQQVWFDHVYPFSYLPRLLGDFETAPEQKRYNTVLLLRSGPARMALHVDALLKNQEVVVKNIGPQLARVPGIAGATVLGNGDIVMIINPLQLVLWHSTAAAQTLMEQQAPATVMAAPEETLQTAPVVMVVDDSLTVRKITGRLLAREGFQVVTAKDGVDALQQLQDIHPAVMLVDIEMPRMDGFELTRNVRNDQQTRDIPIIMITSRTADKHRNYAEELGVNVFLGKPYQEDELLDHIRQALKRQAEAKLVAEAE